MILFFLSDIIRVTNLNAHKRHKLMLIFCIFLVSCSNKQEAIYIVNNEDMSKGISLKDWNVLGPIKYIDTTCTKFLDKDHIVVTGVKECDFIKQPYKYKINVNLDLLVKNGLAQEYYSSQGNIIDYEEISGLKKREINDVKGSAMYLYCKIISSKKEKLYLMTKSTSGLKVWINGKSVLEQSNESRNFDFNFADFITLNITKGINYLVVKKTNLSKEILFEAILGNRKIMLDNYYKRTANSLFFHSIANDKLWLNWNHCKDLDTSITYCINNVDGNKLFSEKLVPNSETYLHVGSLPRNHAYLGYFEVKGKLYSQPFFIGNPDSTYIVLSKKKEKYHDKDILQKINTYLFRLNFLLNHESRKTDWWWEHKVSDILYELENLYNNIEKKQNENRNSFGIQLKSYSSIIDNSSQHYLLITPDGITSKDKLPLVVVIRPVMEILHHSLSSPQLARYWSLTNAKYLANKYRYIVLMPTARLYLNEELIPMAENELLLAINDVKRRYNVDSNKIYLHGNCSAGYRCLKFASHYPHLFAAVGLYAPVYHCKSDNNWIKDNSPENLISNLCNIPILLHYDPIDTHIPYSFFEDFIADSKKYNLNLHISSRKFSGKYYNVLLVGEEAFSFFKEKKRNIRPQQIKFMSYSEKYDSVYWLKWKPISNDKKTSLLANYNKSENKISLICENISELSINLDQLMVSKKIKLEIEIGNKVIFKGVYKKSTFHLVFLKNRKFSRGLVAPEKIIADLFAEPFCFVTDTANGNSAYRQGVRFLIKEYENYLFASPAVLEASQLTIEELKNKNLFFVGVKFSNSLIKNGLSKLPILITENFIEIGRKRYSGKNLNFQSIFISPFNSSKLIVVYGTNNQTNFSTKINCPWKNGLENCIVNVN